jgi:hypothetical protein
MHHKTIVIWVFVSMLLPWESILCEPITSSEYLPLESGNSWTYSVTGPYGRYTETVTVLPGTTDINGVPTKAIKYSGGPDDQSIEYWTSDQQGIRLHGGYAPNTELGPATLAFEPPLVYASSTMNIHDTVSSSGNARFVFDYYGTFMLNYESSSTLEGTETVTVPAGTYETVRTRDSDRIYGSILGEPYEDVSSGGTWLAKYIGEVKGTDEDDNGTEVEVLISTNVKPRPTAPFLPFLQLLLD